MTTTQKHTHSERIPRTMTDEEWAALSDAERIERLELVIDLLLDIMLAEEIARHRPPVENVEKARQKNGQTSGPLPTCD